jgi:hypothetical protein
MDVYQGVEAGAYVIVEIPISGGRGARAGNYRPEFRNS